MLRALYMERLSEKQISKRLQFSKSSVHRAIEKFKIHEIYNDIEKTGRPCKTSRRDEHAIRRAAMRSTISTCCKIRVNLLKNGTKISISTVSRRLSKGFDLKSYKPAEKPRLTSAMKKKRFFVPIKIFIGLWKNGDEFYFLTNLQINSLQGGRGTFKDRKFNSMRSTSSVQ